MQQLKKSENADPNKLVSFIPSLTTHIKSFLPYVIDKENYDAVKYEGDTFFDSKTHEDYGNFLLAVNEFSNGKVEKALERMDYVTKNHPKFKGAHHLKIVILAKLSAQKEYHAAYRNALIDSLKAFPEDLDMKALLANHQIDKEGEKTKALHIFQDIIHHRSENFDSWLDLAFAYLINQDLKMAETCLITSLKLNPTNIRAILMGGIFLAEYGKYEQAIELLEEGQKKFGDDKSLMRNLALLNLQIGNRKKGWEYYCTIKHDDRVSLDRNPHTDEIKELKLKDIKRIKKLKNKKDNSVLVYFEQGVGDYIMFSRYLNLLSSYGFKVTAFGQEDVIVLFKNCKEFKEVKFEHILYPEDFKKFKYKSFIQDLPFLLMEEKIPHPTVFDTKVILEKNKKFLSEFSSNFKKNTQKIGVSWKGNKRHVYDKLRSIDIGLFSKIFKENPDIQFFVIDKGLNPYEKKEISKYSNVINCEKYLNDWNKTTTICLQMDQMVTVDTSLGHMGGTLNVPTNILIANNNDWRWGIKKTDSEWYKSVKLFRQTEFFKWEPVIEKVIKFLKK